jgi:hypothetical protein
MCVPFYVHVTSRRPVKSRVVGRRRTLVVHSRNGESFVSIDRHALTDRRLPLTVRSRSFTVVSWFLSL